MASLLLLLAMPGKAKICKADDIRDKRHRKFKRIFDPE
jgi:hypothetical protein